jgi:hypothetical protein
MKTYVEVDVLITVFLSSSLEEDGWSASRLRRFTRGEKATLSIGYGAACKKATFFRYWYSNSSPSTVQPVPLPYTECVILTLSKS